VDGPLTIAIICHPTLGGSGVVATDLGTALAERGRQLMGRFFAKLDGRRN